jgi:hypothetical protein
LQIITAPVQTKNNMEAYRALYKPTTFPFCSHEHSATLSARQAFKPKRQSTLVVDESRNIKISLYADGSKALMQEDLKRVREWAQTKAQSGQEPPWAWYQYMKLVETLDAILSGMAATTLLADSPESEPRQATHLRLAACNGSQDTSRFHADRPPSGPLPM